ncbi:glycerol-3-phosphate 1-O-acyltransferase PlsY [Brevundimonas sp.]|uniref:glycerol-3-phosphate 1-O-acyltransferase PlsY n=1 Tax=Brevundimonas sp. TaxID=1871086 RepID=UPI0035B4E922
MPFAAMLALMAVGGYLLGSIPFGVILTRLGGAGDVRSIGSGNIGATNVLRTGRKDLAIATLLLDAGKGAAALLLAKFLLGGASQNAEIAGAVAGGAAFLGHLFPVWLKFKGGKGVATFFGLMLAAWWPLGLAAAAIWLLTAALLRMSSLAALVASAAAPLIALIPVAALKLPAPQPIAVLAALTAVLIWVRHHENIARLLKGVEPRIGAKSA